MVQDDRDRRPRFDAISSIGMFEHVEARVAQVFLHPGRFDRWLLLNHAISVWAASADVDLIIWRYAFPDGELIDAGQVMLAMERAGFEVRAPSRCGMTSTLHAWVESLRRSPWMPPSDRGRRPPGPGLVAPHGRLGLRLRRRRRVAASSPCVKASPEGEASCRRRGDRGVSARGERPLRSVSLSPRARRPFRQIIATWG